MNIEERYTKLFCTVFDVDASKLNSGFTFDETAEWDSMAHMELIAALEDEFDVMLEPDEITHFGSYENGKNILRQHGVEI